MIGEVLAVACADREVLVRIGGRIGEAARESAAELATLASEDHRRMRARIAAAARVPVPIGIRGVHASWIEAGLVGLPARARGALANGPTTEVEVWLVRWACAELPPLPAAEPELVAPRSIDDAIRLPGDRLVSWLAELGADQLALALRTAGKAAVAAVAARVVGDRLLAASERIDAAPRSGALGPVRAAIARCRGLDLTGADAAVDELAATRLAGSARGLVDDNLLLRIGARAVAPRVDTLARRQLAVRLPRPLGLVLIEELVAHASTPVDQCPTWLALAAPC